MILFYNRWEGGGRRESLEIGNPMTAFSDRYDWAFLFCLLFSLRYATIMI